MALPHRVVGLICELGKAQRSSTTLPNGDVIPSSDEDSAQIRPHIHLGGDTSDKVFRYHPEGSGNHHYFANFPKLVLTEIEGTLDNGQGTPWDVDGDTYTVRAEESPDASVQVDNLPCWLKAWIEPVSCHNYGWYFTYRFEDIDEGHPEFHSTQGEEGYDSNSARTEAQAYFDLYLARLNESLEEFQNDYLAEEREDPDTPVTIMYPRGPSETPYEDTEAKPYEPAACPANFPFICPWYKSLSDDTVEPTRKFRGFYEFSFSMLNADWGPWQVTDQTPEIIPAHEETASYTYYIWYFDEYVQTEYPDQGMSQQFPDNPPYWTDEDGDGEDDTYWTPYGHSESFTEYYTYWVEEQYLYHTYSFDYPDYVKPDHTSVAKWKIKCEFNSDAPTCCSPVGKTITFKVRIQQANMRSCVPPYEDLYMQSPTTMYRNAALRGYGIGNMGALAYFENHNCGPQVHPYMHWAYYGTIVRPIFTTDVEHSVVTVSKVISETPWDDEYDVEIPAENGKVTFIKDFWIESIE